MEDQRKSSFPVTPDKTQDKSQSNEVELEKVKEIINLLAKTVSLIKIFPPDHSSVKNFINELADKLIKFLESNWKLELDVDEFSFRYQGEVIYKDQSTIKSLPFLFFKDGLQKLFFYKGLNLEQLQKFLAMIKEYYESPPGESDIVSLLWEKDFAHIRYLAPDDFLETKIGTGQRPIEFKIDRQQFETGRIILTPEDREEIKKRALAVETETKTASFEEKIDQQIETESSKLDMFYTSLSDKENKSLKFMLEANRQISTEEEMALLILEILSLEENSQRFSATLKSLENTLTQILKQGNFSMASQVLSHIHELRQTFQSTAKERASQIEKFLNKILNRSFLSLIKETIKKSELTDFSSVFNYLKFLGPEVIPFVGELYGEIDNPSFRAQVLAFLKVVGKENFNQLMMIADEEKPALTQEIISILSSSGEKKAVQLLANFIPYQNKSIKQATILALGRIKDSTANRILVGFLADKEEELRLLAAENIATPLESSPLKFIIKIIQLKSFKKKSHREKQAFLNLLARSHNQLAIKKLEEIITKTGLFSFPKRVESALLAIKALEEEAADKADAILVLKKAIKVHRPKIRKAALASLKRLTNLSEMQK